jgi:hypothetical protein
VRFLRWEGKPSFTAVRSSKSNTKKAIAPHFDRSACYLRDETLRRVAPQCRRACVSGFDPVWRAHQTIGLERTFFCIQSWGARGRQASLAVFGGAQLSSRLAEFIPGPSRVSGSLASPILRSFQILPREQTSPLLAISVEDIDLTERK